MGQRHQQFQSTLPVGGATDCVCSCASWSRYFNPRSPWGERPICRRSWTTQRRFQSTLPVGGATLDGLLRLVRAWYFNPRSPWGERLQQHPGLRVLQDISIHAPRGGSDRQYGDHSRHGDISIHAPRGGSDANLVFSAKLIAEFQSTLPVGGATLSGPAWRTVRPISIHAPRGGSDQATSSAICARDKEISIHAPRGGSDPKPLRPQPNNKNFNPRSPWGERLLDIALTVTLKPISIHAPRGGSDFFGLLSTNAVNYFNPRSPWGERHLHRHLKDVSFRFQSTLPVGGATDGNVNGRYAKCISIHAPRGGSDRNTHNLGCKVNDFNPRSPWGERLHRKASSFLICYFNPRSPWGERPPGGSTVTVSKDDFNPRSPWGERPKQFYMADKSLIFQSTLPVGGATVTRQECQKTNDISIHAPRGGSDRF